MIRTATARRRENGLYGNHRRSRSRTHHYYAVQCPHCGFKPFTYADVILDSTCSNLGKGCGKEVKASEWIIDLDWVC